eukprot:6472640-Amphidinium_carterae.1
MFVLISHFVLRGAYVYECLDVSSPEAIDGQMAHDEAERHNCWGVVQMGAHPLRYIQPLVLHSKAQKNHNRATLDKLEEMLDLIDVDIMQGCQVIVRQFWPSLAGPISYRDGVSPQTVLGVQAKEPDDSSELNPRLATSSSTTLSSSSTSITTSMDEDMAFHIV